MKTYRFILFLIFLQGSVNIAVLAQDKNEQLWYCWEETVMPGKIEEYKKLSSEFIDVCTRENFPFSFYTWSSTSHTFELWTPVESFSDIEKIIESWELMAEKLGAEKYDAFRKTRLHNKSYTCTVKNDLCYFPQDPDYPRKDIRYQQWTEIYLKEGKQEEFESALKWLNEERAKKECGCYVFYATGGFGYEIPCYIVMVGNTTKEEFVRADKQVKQQMEMVWEKYLEKINPCMRKPPKVYDWQYFPELSYVPKFPGHEFD